MEMKKMRWAMPIGVDDFSELITKNYCFVDKTRFIQEILDGHSKVTLITRPRRFGKTLNLSMLRYFFSIENGAKNRELFAGLDIERAGEKYMAQQGSRPVVFLSLKDVQARDFAGMMGSLEEILSQSYDRFSYLENSPGTLRGFWKKWPSLWVRFMAVKDICRIVMPFLPRKKNTLLPCWMRHALRANCNLPWQP